MNLKLIGCIAMGVFVAHLAIFMMIFGVRSRSARSTPPPEAPNLRICGRSRGGPCHQGEDVNREITVEYEIAFRGVPAERSDPPSRK
jgi:hypothetical protein